MNKPFSVKLRPSDDPSNLNFLFNTHALTCLRSRINLCFLFSGEDVFKFSSGGKVNAIEGGDGEDEIIVKFGKKDDKILMEDFERILKGKI